MPHWVPSWQLAMTVAGSIGVISLAARIWLHRGAESPAEPTTGPANPAKPARGAVAALFGWEVAILIGLYGMWQLAGSLAVVGTNDGISRGQHLWNLERHLHLPSEATFQSPFLSHPLLIKFFNLYYVLAHYNVLLLMLAWLFWRHRDHYREARTVIALTTFACLAVQLIPVAPPRLIGGHGIVDTALRYGQSVYGPVGQGFSDQYSAMPSVHIAWCSAVAFFVWREGSGRWRYLGVAHALLTWTVVVATGNHYWLDGVVAIALLALAFWAVRLAHLAAARMSKWLTWTATDHPGAAGPMPVPLPAYSPPAASSPDVGAPVGAGLPATTSPPSP